VVGWLNLVSWLVCLSVRSVTGGPVAGWLGLSWLIWLVEFGWLVVGWLDLVGWLNLVLVSGSGSAVYLENIR
jgi:hypothetical protein